MLKSIGDVIVEIQNENSSPITINETHKEGNTITTIRGTFQSKLLADAYGGRNISVANIKKIYLSDADMYQLNYLLSQELIRSVKGAKSIIKGEGDYEYGILRNVSPSGRRWSQLSKSTLRIRQAKAKSKGWVDFSTGEHRKEDIARGQSFKLRETSKNIYNGLKILYVDKDSFQVGWDDTPVRSTGITQSKLAVMQNDGFTFKTKVGETTIRKAEKIAGGQTSLASALSRHGVNKTVALNAVKRLKGNKHDNTELSREDALSLKSSFKKLLSSNKYGKSVTTIKVPARQFIGVQAQFENRVGKIIDIFINNKYRGKFLTRSARIK